MLAGLMRLTQRTRSAPVVALVFCSPTHIGVPMDTLDEKKAVIWKGLEHGNLF
jgi:hypothetical protein